MSGLWSTFAGAGLGWPPAFSVAGREQWLDARLGCYRAAQVANGIVRGDDHLLTNDPRSYWIRCLVTDARAAPATLTQDAPASESADGSSPLSSRLRRLGVTHLLLVDPADGDPVTRDPLSRLADQEIASAEGGELLPLVEYVKTVGDSERRYRLIAVRRESKLGGEVANAPAGGSRHVATRNVIPDTRQQSTRQR